MVIEILSMLALAFVAVSVSAQVISIITSIGATQRRVWSPRKIAEPGVSVVRIVCGIENNIEKTLATTFSYAYKNYEIIFCVASPSDPVIPVLEKLIEKHPDIPAKILIGDDHISGNPKLNNLAKGWEAAKNDWILLVDSNVLLPADYILQLLARWTPGTGLVTSPPAGVNPDGFWARLECAFLNTYQGRWQLAADWFDGGFAQGKILFWRRDILENAGGVRVLGREMAEDVASTKVVRAAGLKVRVIGNLFPQPLGERDFSEVWKRQMRWSRIRRKGFIQYFLPEILSGSVPAMAALLWLTIVGWVPLIAIPAVFALWYSLEHLLARVAGWPHGYKDFAAELLRDLLLPALWMTAWVGRGFEWRGNTVTSEKTELRG